MGLRTCQHIKAFDDAREITEGRQTHDAGLDRQGNENCVVVTQNARKRIALEWVIVEPSMKETRNRKM